MASSSDVTDSSNNSVSPASAPPPNVLLAQVNAALTQAFVGAETSKIVATNLPDSGTYWLNMGTIPSNSNKGPSKFYTGTFVTFDKKNNQITLVTFSSSGKPQKPRTFNYDYVWGAPGSEQIILGDGKGGYYLLTDPNVFPSSYTYYNHTYGGVAKDENYWAITNPDGSITKLMFGNDGFQINESALDCFLAGTLISSKGSLIAVEDLRSGDEIDILFKGKKTQRKVAEVYKSTCQVKTSLPPDCAGYPVRIVKDAFAEGVPFKDMLVTPEHCLFFDGCFVPVRMLVNGRSIFYDLSFESYDYYHIVMRNHAIITADGVLTESYVDDLHITWADSAAPLNCSRAFVEPLFQNFHSRALEKGFEQQPETAPVSALETNLRLIVDSNIVVNPLRREGNNVFFALPEKVKNIQIISNAARPCDVIGPFIDDRRQLGVLVGDIKLIDKDKVLTISSHLQQKEMQGWNNMEAVPMRWTDGDAHIELETDQKLSNAACLSLQIIDSVVPSRV